MTRENLEWWILFTIAVAGKSAKQTEKKMRELLSSVHIYGFDSVHVCETASPFALVEYLVLTHKLDKALRRVKLGKYRLLNQGFRAAIKLDLSVLEKVTPQEALRMLMAVPGLGPKGARMILLYAYPSHANQWAVLDTHVLRWLRERCRDAPKSTPSGKKYLALEAAFRAEAHRLGLTLRELDTRIWNSYSKLSGDPSQGF